MLQFPCSPVPGASFPTFHPTVLRLPPVVPSICRIQKPARTNLLRVRPLSMSRCKLVKPACPGLKPSPAGRFSSFPKHRQPPAGLHLHDRILKKRPSEGLSKWPGNQPHLGRTYGRSTKGRQDCTSQRWSHCGNRATPRSSLHDQEHGTLQSGRRSASGPVDQ